jgi:hypothetical protein
MSGLRPLILVKPVKSFTNYYHNIADSRACTKQVSEFLYYRDCVTRANERSTLENIDLTAEKEILKRVSVSIFKISN